MSAFKNIGINDYFARYGLKYGFTRAIFTANPFHIVNDYEQKKILYYKKAEKKIKKNYLKFADTEPKGLSFGENDVKSPIWVYWKQGVDNAPDIVKACIESIKANSDGNVIILTDENAGEYVKFPSYITEGLEKGNISTAAFSDLLRFSLLEHYGGTWIDSTVYMTGKIPDYIMKSDFFAFQDSFGLIKNPALMSVWFLHCSAHNKVIKQTRNIAFSYWCNEKYVIEYLIPYIILTTVLENNPKEYYKVPYANSDYSHLLSNSLDEKFDSGKYNHIIEMVPIHKLTYKLKDDVYGSENNFYNKIIGK